ncbi:hypothetical protein MCOR27_007137 [Pyricularia oryzae]|nr:hypothetical protein MCOR27_007137 [Pyricularia oryzae]KAI6406328.1 hypothetical protein MCOR20_006218 [Pyricularia oryzae]KAI6425908.1 hypothetical protein MCOR21_006954 [Pyricularia oryzae]KAI6512300.1 hypothetical protein MCOR13_000106 [Pyricularia oryzae]KAI6560515.1 hypothetical protein MCOR03_004297 [Pyricularia oryzae]
MSRCQQVGRTVTRCLRPQQHLAMATPSMSMASRSFSSTAGRRDDVATTAIPPPENKNISPARTPAAAKTTEASTGPAAAPSPPPDSAAGQAAPAGSGSSDSQPAASTDGPTLAPKDPMVGSRRKQAAIAIADQSIPFAQLPFQCFQEARKVLHADRQEKIVQIVREAAKIKALEARDPETVTGGDRMKQMRLESMREYLNMLKVQADINDPEVKRRFEDGLGDMNKPVYRHLAEQKWRGLPYRVIKQRIEQFSIIPDLLPKFEPVMDVQMSFRQRKTPPGTVVDSLTSEKPPTLRVQVFNKGERLVTVAVIDNDVPVVDKDGFARRCHFLAANIPIDPTTKAIPLMMIRDEQKHLAVPWLPPFSQKGAPKHRLSIFIMEQKNNEIIDVAKLREAYIRSSNPDPAKNPNKFSIKSLKDKFPALEPVGFNIFRTEWDEYTADVMARNNIPGADVEFKHARVHSMKPERGPRGWEAKRQGPKYRHLWKYTHRIATPKRKFVK